MSDDLSSLAEWAAPILRNLNPAQTRTILWTAAKGLRTANIRRIRAQHGPDGEAWEKRKRLRKVAPAIRYVYRAKDKSVRELEMSSYNWGSDRITGYDKEAGGLRTMLKTGLIKKLTPQHGGASLRQRASTTGRMMQRLVLAKYLQAHARNGQAAVVEFSSRAQRIASIHHYGLRDRVNRRDPSSPEVQYAKRELLGFTDADLENVEDILMRHLTEG